MLSQILIAAVTFTLALASAGTAPNFGYRNGVSDVMNPSQSKVKEIQTTEYTARTAKTIYGQVNRADFSKIGLNSVYKFRSEIVDRGPCGKAVSYTFNSNGLLTISGVGDMDNPWATVLVPWDKYRNEIKEIIIEDGVTSIGRCSFEGCQNLVSVKISNSVVKIDDYAFKNCDNLTSITIPESVTSIEDYVFEGCDGLIDITIPSGITSIGCGAFANCKNLTKVFYYGVVEPLFAKQSYCGKNVFEDDDKLANIVVSQNYQESSFCGTSIYRHNVGKCGENVDYTLYDGVLTISGSGNMYEESLYFGDFSYLQLPWEEYKDSIEKVIIEEGVTSIAPRAFDGCGNLTSIEIPNNMTTIGHDAFRDCVNLKNISIPADVSYIGEYAFKNCISLNSVAIPEGVTSISAGMFRGCENLAEVTMPDTLKFIMGSAFENCKKLSEVVIPKGVIQIGDGTFARCSNLVQVVIPDEVVFIGDNAFEDCSKLVSINIPSNVTEIEDYVFAGCSSLKSVVLPHNITAIKDNAFSGCSNLSQVIIPDSVALIGEEAFLGCSNLNRIIIPDKVTWIGSRAFANCTNLTYVEYFGAGSPKCGDSVFLGDILQAVNVSTAYRDDDFCDANVSKNESSSTSSSSGSNVVSAAKQVAVSTIPAVLGIIAATMA